MTARELIEQEWGGGIVLSDMMQAAERVIDRLQRDCATLAANYDAQERRAKTAERRVEELQDALTRDTHSTIAERERQRERYRDRLDRMVAAVMPMPMESKYGGERTAIATAIALLAAIDAAVVAYAPREERK